MTLVFGCMTTDCKYIQYQNIDFIQKHISFRIFYLYTEKPSAMFLFLPFVSLLLINGIVCEVEVEEDDREFATVGLQINH